jgi:hypothetical protein
MTLETHSTKNLTRSRGDRPRPPSLRRYVFVRVVPRHRREPGGHHHPHRAEVPQDRDPPQAVRPFSSPPNLFSPASSSFTQSFPRGVPQVEAGGGPEDGARGLAP